VHQCALSRGKPEHRPKRVFCELSRRFSPLRCGWNSSLSCLSIPFVLSAVLLCCQIDLNPLPGPVLSPPPPRVKSGSTPLTWSTTCATRYRSWPNDDAVAVHGLSRKRVLYSSLADAPEQCSRAHLDRTEFHRCLGAHTRSCCDNVSTHQRCELAHPERVFSTS
jgi:hypothetical protein